MRELLSVGQETLELVGSAAGTVVFSFGGLVVEQEGLRNLLTGQTTLGGWEAGMGLLLLFAGTYMLGYQELLPRLRALGHSY
ncbi:MAG: hypothetical protein ABEH56_04545 [Salinirussus sp.]